MDKSRFFLYFFEPFIAFFVRTVLGPPDIPSSADTIVRRSQERAFRTFREARFRSILQFETTDTQEQDRIFNELVVMNLTFIILTLDMMIRLGESGRGTDLLVELRNAISEQYLVSLRTLGIAKEYIDLWEKLLTMRRDEYEELRLEMRGEIPEFGEGNPWSRVLPIGCLYHIRRGEGMEKDPILEFLMEDVVILSATMNRVVIREIRRLPLQ